MTDLNKAVEEILHHLTNQAYYSDADYAEATQALLEIINNEKIAEVDNLRREFWRTTWTPYDPDSIFADRIATLKKGEK